MKHLGWVHFPILPRPRLGSAALACLLATSTNNFSLRWPRRMSRLLENEVLMKPFPPPSPASLLSLTIIMSLFKLDKDWTKVFLPATEKSGGSFKPSGAILRIQDEIFGCVWGNSDQKKLRFLDFVPGVWQLRGRLEHPDQDIPLDVLDVSLNAPGLRHHDKQQQSDTGRPHTSPALHWVSKNVCYVPHYSSCLLNSGSVLATTRQNIKNISNKCFCGPT